MHHQTQANTQVFTIFGNYPLEQIGDYSPPNYGRSNRHGRCDTGKIIWTDILQKLRASLSGINPR